MTLYTVMVYNGNQLEALPRPAQPQRYKDMTTTTNTVGNVLTATELKATMQAVLTANVEHVDGMIATRNAFVAEQGSKYDDIAATFAKAGKLSGVIVTTIMQVMKAPDLADLPSKPKAAEGETVPQSELDAYNIECSIIRRDNKEAKDRHSQICRVFIDGLNRKERLPALGYKFAWIRHDKDGNVKQQGTLFSCELVKLSEQEQTKRTASKAVQTATAAQPVDVLKAAFAMPAELPEVKSETALTIVPTW